MSHTRYQQLELDLAALKRMLDTKLVSQSQYNAAKANLIEPVVGIHLCEQVGEEAVQSIHPVVVFYTKVLTAAFQQGIGDSNRPTTLSTPVPEVENLLQEGGYRLGQIAKASIDAEVLAPENVALVRALGLDANAEVRVADQNIMEKAEANVSKTPPVTEEYGILLSDSQKNALRYVEGVTLPAHSGSVLKADDNKGNR